MKTAILATFCFLQFIVRCVAGSPPLPEIPLHKLGVQQVVSIFESNIHKTNYMVVSIDWAKASVFQPREPSAHYSPASDHPDEFSWFVTYAYKDAFLDRLLKQRDQYAASHGELNHLESSRQFNAINVMRIKDDGSIGVFMGFQ